MTQPAHPILPTHQVLSSCFIKGESTLDEVLTDPLMQLMARSAGLSLQDLRELFERARQRLAAGPSSNDA
jgi:hypothetical protein